MGRKRSASGGKLGERLTRRRSTGQCDCEYCGRLDPKDPTAAATYAASHLEGDAQEKATIAVVSAWAEKDPAQAARWVGLFPEDSVREQAMEPLMNAWAGNDAVQADQWLESLLQTHSRDAAVNAFSSTVTPSSPAKSFRCAIIFL
jgi:hypothetical protein